MRDRLKDLNFGMPAASLSMGEGRVLRYDLSHSRDAFGFMFRCRFSAKRKAIAGRQGAAYVSEGEFERAWQAALKLTYWQQQQERIDLVVPHTTVIVPVRRRGKR